MNPDETVYRLAQDCFPGRVYRTAQECLAATNVEQEAQRVWDARRHPGDRLRGLGPLTGTSEDISSGQVVRWRTFDKLQDLLALCERAEGGDESTGLTVDEAIWGRWAIIRLRQYIIITDNAAWWAAHTLSSLDTIHVALHQQWESQPHAR